MPETCLPEDARFVALTGWLQACLPSREFKLEVASADASFRRYFRLRTENQSLIAMDAPPEREDSAAFVRVAGILADAGLHTPHIFDVDLEQGFMLLEDLGDRTFLQDMDGANADALFSDAIGALVAMQAASREGVLPDYSRADLKREMQLFPEWYLGRHLGVKPDSAETVVLDEAFDRILDRIATQPRVYVHRDYMPRNLMCSAPNPGVIDFQDARYGPLTYDLLSLFKDAFVSWPPHRIDGWVEDYWQRARQTGLPVPDTLQSLRRDMDWMGLQRHLKVIGIFARIAHRDGKPHYLKDVPRFAAYLRDALQELPELAALARLLNKYLPPQETG